MLEPVLTRANGPAVFSKSYCPYCRASKKLLTELGASYYAIELDQVGMSSPPRALHVYLLTRNHALADDGAEIQAHLATLTGQSTVPNIYINKQHIGGNSDLQSKKGELPDLLKEAGAIKSES
jgi:glutaredoxin 3